MKQVAKILTLTTFFLFYACSNSDDSSNENNQNQTPDNLEIITIEGFEIKPFSATTGGEITNDSEIILIERGIVWSSNANPTENDNVIVDNSGLGVGTYVLEFDCLDIETTYYVRAYARSSSNIYYGNEISFTTLPHNVFQGDLVISTQAEIDNFGANDYSKINGNLTINAFSENLNLENLTGLSEITGDLIIQSSISFTTNLNGLNCLKEVGGILVVARVGDLGPLSSLERVGLSLILDQCNTSSFQAFDNLEYIGSGLSFINSSSTTNLSGFSNVTFLGNAVTISNNQSLSNINILENVNSDLNGTITIINNANSLNINGFNNITYANQLYIGNDNSNGTINVEGFSSLLEANELFITGSNNFEGLNSINKINIKLEVIPSTGAEQRTIQGLSNVTSIGLESDPNAFTTLRIRGVENFNALDQVQSIKGNVLIGQIGNALSFDNLTSIEGNLEITFSGFSSMAGFPSLSSVSGHFLLLHNDFLTSLNGLENLLSVGSTQNTGTPLNISWNSSLSDYCALIPLLSTGFDNNGFGGVGTNNLYNPTITEILNGNCSN